MKPLKRRAPVAFGTSLAIAILAMGFQTAQAQQSTFSPLLSDEFNDAASLSDWTPLPSNPVTATVEDIDTSEPGKLLIVPTQFNQNGWFGTSIGPFRFKLIQGDFIATSHIIAGNVNSPNNNTVPPTGTYNSAGFVVRDPASINPTSENWLMYNHGAQVFSGTAGHSLATETKTTVDSASVLTLRPTLSASSNAGQLTICRSGDQFHMFKWMDDESDWAFEATYIRPDLPETLQVGLVVNGWTQADLRAEFDYIRIINEPVDDAADCLVQLPEPSLAMLLGPGLLTLAALRRRPATPRTHTPATS